MEMGIDIPYCLMQNIQASFWFSLYGLFIAVRKNRTTKRWEMSIMDGV